MTSSSVEANELPEGRECDFFRIGRCKRASGCKLRHVERNCKGDIKKEWPTRWQSYPVARMDPDEMSRTWASRTSLGILLPLFLNKHGVHDRISGSRRSESDPKRTRFELKTDSPNSVVLSIAQKRNLSSQHIYFSHNNDDAGTERSDPTNHESIKLTNQGGIPERLYHCTSLCYGLGALVTGHLVASNDSRPRAVYFSPSLENNKNYDEGVIFAARLHGLYPGKKISKMFYNSIVPMAIVGRLERSAEDWVCDSFSHQLLSVTFHTDLLRQFLAEWCDAGQPVLPLPVPPMVTRPSHTLLADLEPLFDLSVLQELTAQHDKLVARRARYWPGTTKRKNYQLFRAHGFCFSCF